MLTLKLIRDDKDFVINRLKIKNFDATELVEKIIACDDRRKECQHTKDTILKELNDIAKQVGQLFAQGKKEEAEQAKLRTSELKEKVKELENQQTEAENE
ncbi:MAG: serine--tRNA ligase, partial [Bacteroidales bacterium]|nr:serine--tRNA ligase [Bacteroidales bacterium]